MTSAPPHVETRGLSVVREDRCLVRDLDLAVPRGTFVAVVGASGVGKSSLLATLGGWLPPGAGTVTYAGQHAPAAYRRRLGLVFQHLRLTPNASVLTNVLCGLLGQRPWTRTLFGFAAADRARALALLARFELDQYAALPAAKISGGERQRVALARALIAEPDVLLADEPVASLDDRLARRVLDALREETRARQRTVFCVLHDADYVAEFADATLTLRRDDPAAWTFAA